MVRATTKGMEQMERRQCSATGCVNKAQANGKCRKHTGGGQCSELGCEKQAQFKGLCVAHGGRRICTHPECSRTAASRGKCAQHGGGRRRIADSRGRAAPDHSFTSKDVVVPNQESMMSLLVGAWAEGVETNGDDQQIQHFESNSRFPATALYDNPKFPPLERSVAARPVSPISLNHAKESSASMMSLLLEEWPHGPETTVERNNDVHHLIGVPSNMLTASEDTRPRKSRVRALCSQSGCSKIAQSEGLCVGHGGKRCSHPGCAKGAQSRGLCIAHGGSRTCSHAGCTKMVRSAGRCFEHGGGKHCTYSGCDKQAQQCGLCHTHRRKQLALFNL